MTLFGPGSHVTEEYEPCLIKKNNIKNVFHLSLTCFQNRSRPLQQESVETQLLLSTGGANINTKGRFTVVALKGQCVVYQVFSAI